MKALLKTRCGCTRLIDILHPSRSIRIPLPEKMKYVETFRYDVPVNNIREFILNSEEYLIDDTKIPVYIEA